MDVLHLAPHPDDELLGAGATLLALRDAGHRVVNLACTLGSAPAARPIREAEVRDACARARLELLLPEAGATVEDAVAAAVADVLPALVLSPSPHDVHPAHEAVARAAGRALVALPEPPRWWTWGLWADLPHPTLLVEFGAARLAELVHALEAYASQLARNDLGALLPARATVARVLGPERVFGFGAAGVAGPYAELLAEHVPRPGRWEPGTPRRLDPANPLG